MTPFSKITRAALVVLAIALALPSHAADRRIKLGTAAPRDSSFHKILREMGANWKSAGIRLTIYPGGVKGGEAEMVREMTVGSLDGCLLTAIGLSEIDPTIESLQSIPLMYRSLEEFDYVAARLQPILEKRLRAKGFVVLFWADAGWVRFFSTRPVTRPDDLRRLKLFTWAGDVLAVDLYKRNRFQPVVLETEDILPALNTGMIEAVPLPPYVALVTQIYVQAPYMLDLDWAPLAGALVITERSWNRLSHQQQQELARAAEDAGRKMRENNRRESDRAVEVMQKKGRLTITPVSQQAETEWRATAKTTWPILREKKISPQLFDLIEHLLEEFRSNGGNS